MADHDSQHRSPFQFPQSSGKPLHILSSERVNRQAPQPGMPPQSPSELELKSPRGFGHPEFGRPGDFSKFSKDEARIDFKVPASPTRFSQSQSSAQLRSPGAESEGAGGGFDFSTCSPPKLHARTNSDVQCMVARFNSLDIRDHADMRKKDAAALKRAQMGREEAEEEVKRLREEGRALKKEVDEGRDRERRVVKRLDVVMEDLHRTKETQAHAQTLYEKEIRKARKEAFKSSSTLVKLQEELKIARRALGVVQSDLDLERIKGGRREQDAFTSQYQLVGAQEELAQAQAQLKVVEEERDALKMTLKEEEVSRIAAEGKIALPPSKDVDDEFGSPTKLRPVSRPQTPSKDQSHNKQDVERLKEELQIEMRRREEAEEQAEFLKMECQFGCCACKTAERQGRSFMHDGSFEAEVQKFKDTIANILTSPESMEAEEGARRSSVKASNTKRAATPQQTIEIASDAVAFSPNSGTFRVPPVGAASLKYQRSQQEAPIVESQDTTVIVDEGAKSEKGAVMASPGNAIEVEPALDSDLELPTTTIETSTAGNVEERDLNEDAAIVMSDIEGREQQPPPAEHDLEPAPNTSLDQSFRTVTTTIKIPLADASTPDYSAFCSPMKLTREEAIEKLRQRRGRARSIAGTPKKPSPDGRTPRRDISAPETRIKNTPRQVLKRLG